MVSAGKSVNKKRVNIIVLAVALALFLIFNIVISIYAIVSYFHTQRLTQENRHLSSELTKNIDHLARLDSINKNNEQKITVLSSALEDNTILLEGRLESLQDAEQKLEELLGTFNELTGSDMKISDSSKTVATSRSSLTSRFAPIPASPAEQEKTVIGTAKSLLKEDEITNALKQKLESMDQLSNDLLAQLDYLDARPDFYPTYGMFTSGFGYRSDPASGLPAMHTGIDIANDVGTEIYAAGTGYVLSVGYTPSYGYVVSISHGYGYTSVYAHCSEILVEEGQKVEKGDAIALMGATGYATGSHLHFEIRFEGTPIDPLTILNH